MRRASRGGDIKLRCLIGENGAVREAEVMKSSTRELETPALHAVFQWTFKPARRNGVPVAHWVIIPMSFTLID
jgi:protein TonB